MMLPSSCRSASCRSSWPNIIAITVMALVLFNGSASAAFKHVDEGMKFPELTGNDVITGDKVSSSDLVADGAEAVVVVFWATWSARSIELLSDMKKLAAEHEGRPFQVLAVNVEGQRISAVARKEIDKTLAELDLPFPTLLDPDLDFFKSFGVIAVPSTAVLDNKHVLRAGPSGYSFVVRDAIADSVEVLLGLKTATSTEALVRGYQPKSRALSYFNMAVQLTNKGHFERALKNVDRATAADTLFSTPHSLRGQILLELARIEEAELAFAKAVELDSTSVVAWSGWGSALLQLDHLIEAEATLENALNLDPTYTPTLLSLARCRLRQGDNLAAEAHLMAALELNSRDPKVLYNLGSFYHISERNAEALTAYRTALEQLGY